MTAAAGSAVSDRRDDAQPPPATIPSATTDEVRRRHRALLQAWIALVGDRSRRGAQHEHDDLAEQWHRHRLQHLEPPP